MRELKKALRPVKKRLRLLRAVQSMQSALIGGALAALLLLGASFFLPIEHAKPAALLLFLFPPALFMLISLVLPVSDKKAAARADAGGLMERVQTALENESKPETPMTHLQKEDALACLNAFDQRTALRPRAKKITLLIASILTVLSCVLCFIPNPQSLVILDNQALRAALDEKAAQVEEKAKQLTGDTETEKEMNKILNELAKKLREAKSSREALTAVSQSEEALKALKKRTKIALRDALENAGASDLAQALDKNTDAAARALSELGETAQQTLLDAAALADNDLAQMLKDAAEALDGLDLSNLKSAGSLDLKNAQLIKAAQILQGTLSKDGTLSAADIDAMLTAARAAGGGQSSQKGTGKGSGGAGFGSTNEDQGTSAISDHSTSSGVKSTLKTGEYEKIYDPTRLGDGGEVSNVSGQTGAGDVLEMDLGPGAGSLDDTVPYNQVALEYADAASKSAENAALPEYARDWISTYFNSLLEE